MERTQPSVGRQASAETAIRLARDAAQANLRCPYRKGALVELPAAGELMISGDLHGNLANFQAVVQKADLFRHPERHLVVQELVHQEDIPRGQHACRSYRLVEMAARLKTMFPQRLHVLMSNHEFAELNDLPIGKKGRWLNELFEAGLVRAYADRWREVKSAFKEFWRSLPLALHTANGVFVSHATPSSAHVADITYEYLAGLRPGEDLERSKPPFYMVWGRDFSPETAETFARQVKAELVVVGHTPVEEGYAVPTPRHIVLDSLGAGACFLTLPLDRPISQEEALMRIRPLVGSPSGKKEEARE